MRFLTPKDRDVMRKLLTLAGGDLRRVEQALRESDTPRRGVDLGEIASALKKPASHKRRVA